MPTPNPEPTPAQLVDVADVLSLTIDATSEALAADEDQDISNAKWAKTIVDLATLTTLQDDAGDVKKVASIEFFENKTSPLLLRVINRIRRRYGVLELEVTCAETVFAPVEIIF